MPVIIDEEVDIFPKGTVVELKKLDYDHKPSQRGKGRVIGVDSFNDRLKKVQWSDGLVTFHRPSNLERA